MLSTPTMDAPTEVEQEFFDRVLDEREQKRLARTGASTAGADNKARSALKKNTEADTTLGNPDDPVAFLRIDTHDGDGYYVGKAGVSDSRNDRLVYAWNSNLILKLRAATHDEPGDVVRHRKYQTRLSVEGSMRRTIAGSLLGMLVMVGPIAGCAPSCVRCRAGSCAHAGVLLVADPR